MDETLTNTEHDELFYFDDDPMCIFLVENRLFKVHRYYLIQGSEVFRNMFISPTGSESHSVEGTCDEKPIALPDVTVKEFQVLLRFLYQLHIPTQLQVENHDEKSRMLGINALSLDEKLALLSISHRFLFEAIFKYAFDHIEPTDVPIVDRIRLGDKYGHPEWLVSAYKSLLDSAPGTSVTDEEIQALGPEGTISLFRAKYFMSQERLAIAQKELKRSVCKCDCKKCTGCLSMLRAFKVPGPTPTPTNVVVEKFFHTLGRLPSSSQLPTLAFSSVPAQSTSPNHLMEGSTSHLLFSAG